MDPNYETVTVISFLPILMYELAKEIREHFGDEKGIMRLCIGLIRSWFGTAKKACRLLVQEWDTLDTQRWLYYI